MFLPSDMKNTVSGNWEVSILCSVETIAQPMVYNEDSVGEFILEKF